MVERSKTWRIDNEDSLARSWEQKLKPRVNPRPRRRRLAPWVRPALWIMGIWGAALIPAILASHVLVMSYQYDQMNQRYAALTRQNQVLAAQVATKDTPAALARDASRLKVALVEPHMAVIPRSHHVASKPLSPIGRVTAWISRFGHAMGR